MYDRAENNERKQLLYDALSKLSSKERSAVLLFEISGFSVEEIRVIQNERSLSAVKSRLSRARKKLRTSISELENNHSLPNYKKNFTGDLEHETLKVIAESDARK